MAKTKAKVAAKPKPKPAVKKPAKAAVNGAAEAAAWVAARGLSTTGKARWNVRVALDVRDEPASEIYSGATDSRFMLAIYQDEWGFTFIHKGKTSHIRRVAEDFVNGFDQHKLLRDMPALDQIGTFVRELETKHGIALKRGHANVRTNLAKGKAAVRTWVSAL